MGQAMERNDDCDIAIMVYNYLIEQRMMQVAEMFSQASPYLPRMRRCDRGCMYITQPFRSLQEVVRDYVALNQKMKLLLMKYYKEVKLPHEKTTWEKVMCVVEHFCSKMNTESSSDSVKTMQNSTSHSVDNLSHPNNPPPQEEERCSQEEVVMQEQLVNKPLPLQDGPIIYQFSDEQQQMEVATVTTQLEESQFVYQMGEFVTIPNGEGVAETPTHPDNQPMVVYVVNNGEQQTEIGGEAFVQTVNNGDLQGCSPAMTMSFEEDVTIAQQVEIGTEFVESCTPEHLLEVPSSTLHNHSELPTTELKSSEAEPEQVLPTLAETPSASTVPMDISIQNGPSNPEQVKADVPLNEQQEVAKPDERSNVREPGPSLPELNTPQPKRTTDPAALREWNRIRSINRSNFDDYVREMNYQEEVKQRLERVIEDKKNREKKRAEKRMQTIAIKTVIRPGQNPKSPCSSAVKKHPAKTPQKQLPMALSLPQLDSDTSDFDSSMDEDDDDVRQMAQNIKRYRKQQQQQQQTQAQPSGQVKGKQTQDPKGESSNSPLQCRVTMVTGRTPRQTAVKRNLRTRTPSTSPAATPIKRTKQQTTAKTPVTKTPAAKTSAAKTPAAKTLAAKTSAAPVTPRPGTIRQQQAKAKQATKPMAEASNVTQRPVRASAAAKRRSKEAVQDKTKQTLPTAASQASPRKEENVPAPSVADVPSKVEEALVTSNTKRHLPTLETTENSTPVEEGEAAIYAVLAQLHGDD